MHVVYLLVLLTTGKGLFADKSFSTGEFLVEYKGKLKAASNYENVDDLTYVYYFVDGRKELW